MYDLYPEPPEGRTYVFVQDRFQSRPDLPNQAYLFRLHRRSVPGSRIERFEVEFTGDVDELRREHFLTLVPVHAELEVLADEVGKTASQYVASLRPGLRKIVSPLSVACR